MLYWEPMKNSKENAVDPDFSGWLDDIRLALHAELPRFPEAISEYELITRLSQPPYSLLDKSLLHSVETAFEVHFPLFHCLYTMKPDFYSQGFELQIHALSITLIRVGEGSAEQACTTKANLPESIQDPLAGYYLDLDRYFNAKPHHIKRMVERFWQGLSGSDTELETDLACELLGCEPDDSPAEIKKAFRRKAQALHPDRGGNPADFVKLRQAYETLCIA